MDSANYYRLLHILRDQYPSLDVVSLLDNADLEMKISRRTGRISQILIASVAMLSLRTSDGRYVPTYAGGLWLLSHGLTDRRVIVSSDAVPFVSSGKSLYIKHILSFSEDIHVGEECFMFDPSGNFIAVGTSLHPSYAFNDLNSGVGVRVKHYNKV